MSMTTRPVLALLLLAVLVHPSAAGAQTCGDADRDGAVTLADARRIMRTAVLLPVACDLAACDTDDDGQLTSVDGVRVLQAAAGAPVALACDQLGPRRRMLRSLVVVVILPGYRQFDGAAAALETAVAALVAAPSEITLDAARSAWRAARGAWKRTEAFRLGPSEHLRTRARVDWSPIRPDRIEEAIAGAAAFTSADIDALGSNLVGSLALEYLLFDADGGSAGVLAALSGASRRSYLTALAVNLAVQAAALRASWEPAGGNFGEELVNAGLIGGAFATLKAAVDELVNRMVFTAETIEEVKLADPLGINRGGPDPTRLESARSGSSRADILDELAGLRLVYRARAVLRVGAGIGSATRDVSAAADAQAAGLIDEAIAAVRAVPAPLAATLVTHPDLVEDAYLAVQAMRRSLVLDVVPALGVTLTFGGTDGD
jgi:predicted lipoprotein